MLSRRPTTRANSGARGTGRVSSSWASNYNQRTRAEEGGYRLPGEMTNTRSASASSSTSSDFSSILSRLQAQQQSTMQGYMSRLNSNLSAQQQLQEQTNNQRTQVYGRIEDTQRKQELDSRRSLMRSQAQVRDEQEDNALMLQRGLLQNSQRRAYQGGLLTNRSKGTTNLTNRTS